MLHPLYLALPALLFSLTVHGAAIVQLEANKDGDTPPEPLHYGYNGLDGPASWSSIALTCAGQVQSPINIEPESEEFQKTIDGVLDNSQGQYPGIVFPNAKGELSNTGDSLKFTPGKNEVKGTFQRPDGAYDLLQLHFHAPSEHRINGVDYPAVVHFVHTMTTGEKTNLAVIGAFIDFGNFTSPFLESILATMAKTTKGDKVKYDINFEESVTKMKSTKQIYRYTGSLTTPPCTEGVKWHVLSDPTYTITIDHLRQLQGLIKFSARDTQPLYDPYDMDWPVKRKSDYIF